MLTRGGSPQDGRTPLWAASYQGQAAVTHVLLAAGADKEAKDKVRARG